jgi:DNA-binding MarR family transcriptional regulator
MTEKEKAVGAHPAPTEHPEASRSIARQHRRTEPPSDPLSDALQRVLIAHTQARGRLIRSLGSTGTDVDILEYLMSEALGPVALAARLGVTTAAASLAVGRLESRGHVRRERDLADGRRTRVVVTGKGRRVVQEHALPMLLELDDLAACLDPEARAGALAYLRGAERALGLLGA